MTLTEPASTALFLVVFGVLMALSVLFARVADRAGVPVVLLFLGLGMLGGSEGIGGIEFADAHTAFRLGTIALILILFDGGLNTSMGSIRRSIAPAGLLATVGVALTAGIVAVIARLLGVGWPEALLIGAIISSTDAAAVFAVLRGGSLRVRERVRSVIEVESCVNDPMAVILTFAAVEVVATGSAPSLWLLVEVPAQLAIGAVIGAAVGLSTGWLLSRVRVNTAGLFPVATMAAALLAFALATLAWGSGFLAVFAAGAALARAKPAYLNGLRRVHDAFAWFAQVSMFLMFGLLVFPSELMDVAWVGLVLGLGLAFVARPLAVAACLLPLRKPAKDVAYISWVGIRGAVPIVLATIPVMADVQGANEIFHTVFFIIVLSALAPGASIVPVTRRLGLADPSPPPAAASVEMVSLGRLEGEIRVFHVTDALAVCGAKLSDIHFPENSSVVLVVRGEDVLAARGATRLAAGDHVYVYCRPEDDAYISLLFGRAEGE